MSRAVTRRERREQMRQHRSQRPHGPAPRRRRIGGAWIGLGVIAAGAAILFALYALGVFVPGAAPVDLRDKKYDPSNEIIGQQFPDEGNAHINAGQKATYGTNPPTSGSHWSAPAAPAAWGIKDTTLPDEVVVHNMEHGGVVIFYKGLDANETAKLKDLARSLTQFGYPKIILEPYPQLSDARIAISAWRWQLKLATYDDVAIVKFVRAHYDGPDAPERGVR
jgi:hypothetical protein